MQVVMEGIAANPALPENLFETLAKTGDEDVRHVLTYRDDLSEVQARILLAYEDVDVPSLIARGMVPWAEVPRHDSSFLPAAAQAGIAPEVVVRELAEHHAPEVRGELASYVTGLPPDVLATLASDPDPAVAERAAESSDLPADLAAELARHPHVVVRVSLAHNDRIPPMLLAALLADGNTLCAGTVAGQAMTDASCSRSWVTWRSSSAVPEARPGSLRRRWSGPLRTTWPERRAGSQVAGGPA